MLWCWEGIRGHAEFLPSGTLHVPAMRIRVPAGADGRPRAPSVRRGRRRPGAGGAGCSEAAGSDAPPGRPLKPERMEEGAEGRRKREGANPGPGNRPDAGTRERKVGGDGEEANPARATAQTRGRGRRGEEGGSGGSGREEELRRARAPSGTEAALHPGSSFVRFSASSLRLACLVRVVRAAGKRSPSGPRIYWLAVGLHTGQATGVSVENIW